jgi:hypothetical protein
MKIFRVLDLAERDEKRDGDPGRHVGDDDVESGMHLFNPWFLKI